VSDVPDLPPHDEYLERGVLGSILCQPDAEHSAAILDDLAFLYPSDFFREANRAVFLAIDARRLHGRPCLIGDLFGLPGMDSAYLTGLANEALPALVVKTAAVRVAELGMERLLLWGAFRLPQWTPEQVDGFNQRVQVKRERIEAAKTGRPAAQPYAHLLELG
jgi:hypothetical protein